MQRIKSILFVLFFITGFSALIYEVLWVRMFTLIFGATVFAVSTVLTSFFAGLALGSYLFGRIIDRYKAPLPIYGCLELGIGLYAILLYFVITHPWFQGLYAGLFQGFQASFYTFSVIRFALSFLILLIPTTLMGATLPVLSKFYVETTERAGKDIGYLYAINTIGATLGCFFTGFFLIEHFGIRHSNSLAIFLNLLVGGVALYLSITVKSSKTPYVPPKPVLDKIPFPQKNVISYPTFLIVLVLIGFALSGAAALGYEVLWTRILSTVFHSTTYSFTLILTTFLSGLALGSYLFGRYFYRQERLIFFFGIIQIVISIYAIGTIPILSIFPEVLPPLFRQFSESWLSIISIKFILSFLLILPPTLLLGAIFPMISRVCIRNISELGMTLGKIYSINTLGAIFGSFFAGFVLIPVTGVKNGIILIAMINLLIGIVILSLTTDTSRRVKQITILVSVAIIGLSAIFVTRTNFYSGIMMKDKKIVYYEEDLVANVWVNQTQDDMVLMINNDPQNLRHSVWLAKWFGHLPMLLHPDATDVLLVGMGGGVTAGGVSMHPAKVIDIVEIVPSLAETASFFTKENHNVLHDPRTRLIIEDGRNYVLTTRKEYDLIISEIFHPDNAGTGSLYSREFYEQCRRKIREDGMMVQWLTLYQLSPQELKVITATFLEVFPYVTLWFGNNLHVDYSTVALIGTKRSLNINHLALQGMIARDEISNELSAGTDVSGILSNFIMNEKSLPHYVAVSPINTDDRPYIEFSTPKNMWRYRNFGMQNTRELISFKESIFPHLDLKTLDSEEGIRFMEGLKNNEEAREIFVQGALLESEGKTDDSILYYNRARFKAPDDRDLERAISLRLALIYQGRGALEKARIEFERAILIDPGDTRIRLWLAQVYILLNQDKLAWDQITDVIRLHPDNATAYGMAGYLLIQHGRIDQARKALGKAVAIFPYDEKINGLYSNVIVTNP